MRTGEDELLEYDRLVAAEIKTVPVDPAAPRDNKLAHAGGRRVHIIDAKELQHKQFAPIRYILPGYIPEGATLLVSCPKLGKSWLVLDLCIAIAMDRFTLGMLKPTMGDVLYLALEDGERRLQRRITRLLPTFIGEWPSRLKMSTEWPRADESGVTAIEEWIKSVPNPTAVVVDTLQKFRKMQTANGNTYAADYEAVGQLQTLASKYGVAIIIVHHDRKAGADDVFDTISGTQGLTGAADTIAIMKRDGRGVTLYVRGRDVEESETAIQFQKDFADGRSWAKRQKSTKPRNGRKSSPH